MTDGPLIVQSDKTLLLEVDHADAEAARRAIAPFAELERAPEHVHTYRLTPLGLWNARAAGHDAEQVVNALITYSRYAVPHALLVDVADTMDRYGRLTLEKDGDRLVLHSTDRPVLEEILRHKKIQPLLGERLDDSTVLVHPSERGHLKQQLLKVGWPAEDLAGYVDGEAHPIDLDEGDWSLRPYQQQAVDGFWHGGSGVVVLPCGAGKTLVGAGAMARAAGDHADPRHQHRLRPAVARRAAAAHDADRGRDRRVLRCPQGDPAGHHRDLPGADDQAQGRLPAPRPARRPRLGPHPLRRGAPAAGADLPDDRRPAGPATARAHRDAGARGRPRGRRLQPDRAQALRRAVEGHRGAGLHRPRRLRRGAGHPARRRADDLRRWPSRRTATGSRRPPTTARTPSCEALVDRHRGEPTLVIGQYLDQLDDAGRAARRRPDHRRDQRRRAAEAVPAVPHRRDRPARRQQGRELLDRPARGQRRHPGVGHVRVPPGGGPAPRPGPAAEGRRAHRALLHRRRPRHRRRRLRRAPAAVPRRAGLQLPHRRRRRRPAPDASPPSPATPPDAGFASRGADRARCG